MHGLYSRGVRPENRSPACTSCISLNSLPQQPASTACLNAAACRRLPPQDLVDVDKAIVLAKQLRDQRYMIGDVLDEEKAFAVLRLLGVGSRLYEVSLAAVCTR